MKTENLSRRVLRESSLREFFKREFFKREFFKREFFKSRYLENENEFFKNSFETVFRASKSRDRGQLVSAFQLTFNCESHIHLGMLRKTSAKSEKRTKFWTLHKVVTHYNCANANANANANAKRRQRDRCLY